MSKSWIRVSKKIVHCGMRAGSAVNGPGSRVSERSSCGVPMRPRVDRGAGGGERGGEAAVEPDLQHDAGLLGRGDGAVGVGEGHRHRLLAEHVLARGGGRDDQVGVAARGGGDQHAVDVGPVEQGRRRRTASASELGGQALARRSRRGRLTATSGAPGTWWATISAWLVPMRPAPMWRCDGWWPAPSSGRLRLR